MPEKLIERHIFGGFCFLLSVVGRPEWNHVLPQGAVPCETTKPEEVVFCDILIMSSCQNDCFSNQDINKAGPVWLKKTTCLVDAPELLRCSQR